MTAARPWVSAVTPPLAWLVHMTALYLLDDLACDTALRTRFVGGVPLIGVVAGLVTAVTTAASVAAAVAGARALARRDEVARFYAVSAVALGVLFAATIVLESVPRLVWGTCE